MILYSIIQLMAFIVVLLIIHELGHLIAAFLLKLQINSIGFRIKFLPGMYVSIYKPKSPYLSVLFILSGTFTTLALAAICYYYHFWDNIMLEIATILIVISNTNPFYSDVSIILLSHIKSKKNNNAFELITSHDFYKESDNYKYGIWFIYFIFWLIISIMISLHSVI